MGKIVVAAMLSVFSAPVRHAFQLFDLEAGYSWKLLLNINRGETKHANTIKISHWG